MRFVIRDPKKGSSGSSILSTPQGPSHHNMCHAVSNIFIYMLCFTPSP